MVSICHRDMMNPSTLAVRMVMKVDYPGMHWASWFVYMPTAIYLSVVRTVSMKSVRNTIIY